jgi:hypothetical protein
MPRSKFNELAEQICNSGNSFELTFDRWPPKQGL